MAYQPNALAFGFINLLYKLYFFYHLIVFSIKISKYNIFNYNFSNNPTTSHDTLWIVEEDLFLPAAQTTVGRRRPSPQIPWSIRWLAAASSSSPRPNAAVTRTCLG